MKKLRLKESELVNLIRGVINEQFPGPRWQCEPTPLNGECNCIMVVTNAGAQMENNQFGSKEECENNLTLRDGTRNCCSGPVTKDDLKKHPKEPATKSIRLENHLSRRVINEQSTEGLVVIAQGAQCGQDCQQLLGNTFPNNVLNNISTANNPCNWLDAKLNRVHNKQMDFISTLTTNQDGTPVINTQQEHCTYKRWSCKKFVLQLIQIQNNCGTPPPDDFVAPNAWW